MKPRTYSLAFGLAAAMAAALGAGAARAEEEAVTMTRSFCTAQELKEAAGELQCNEAEPIERGLRLTEHRTGESGTAFLLEKLDLSAGKELHTYFRFRIEGDRTGNGMAFLLQDHDLYGLSSNRCGPGYAGLSPSVAFEIDTRAECGEVLAAPHAAITRGGDTAAHRAWGAVGLSDTMHAWVDYDPGQGFRFYLSSAELKPREPLVADTDAAALDEAWVGFSAANSDGQSEHLVTAWAISNEGVPCDCQPETACAGLDVTPVCSAAREAGTRICVQCTAADQTACAGATPVCDAEREVCVQCNEDTDCTAAEAPVCETAAHACGPCTTDAQCDRFPETPVCAVDSGTCEECNVDADCPTAEAPVCDTASHTCGGCMTDEQCARFPDTPVCDADSGTCEPYVEPPGTLEGGGCTCSLPGDGRDAGAAGGLAALLAGAAAAAAMIRRRGGRRG